MIICNTTLLKDADDNLVINTSNCDLNFNKTKPNVTTTDESYNASGAMYFIIAIIVVYSFAVVGVFGLSLLKKRKRQNNDIETQSFMKDFDSVRSTMDNKSRVGAISALLGTLHGSPTHTTASNNNVNGKIMMNNLAFLAMPLSEIQEEDEVQSSDSTNAKIDTGNTADDTMHETSFCIGKCDDCIKDACDITRCDVSEASEEVDCVYACKCNCSSSVSTDLDEIFESASLPLGTDSSDDKTGSEFEADDSGDNESLEDDVFLSETESSDEYFEFDVVNYSKLEADHSPDWVELPLIKYDNS